MGLQMRLEMTAVRRTARFLALAALLASAGVAVGFVVALVRPRPRSRYASLGQPISSDRVHASDGD
jgi:hypothetical protein